MHRVRSTTTPHRRFHSSATAHACFLSVKLWWLAMSAGDGAAWRRRDRQLRAWHRHVRTAVAMELATALHQSAQRPKSRVVEGPSEGEVRETYDARERMHLSRGARGAGSGNHGRSRGCWGSPRVPSLAAAAADGVDDRRERKEDEEERRKVVEKGQKQLKEEDFETRMQALNRRVRHDLPLPDAELAAWRLWLDKALSSSSSAGKRRKRKKKRKNKLQDFDSFGDDFRKMSVCSTSYAQQWTHAAEFSAVDRQRIHAPSVHGASTVFHTFSA